MRKEFMVLVKEEYIRDTQIFDASDALNERRKEHPETPSMDSISDINELLEIFRVDDLDDIEGMDYRDLFSDAVLDYSVKAMSKQEAIEKVSKTFQIPPFALIAVERVCDGMEEEALIINEISIIENQMYEDADCEDMKWFKEEEITELADEIKNSYEFMQAMSAIREVTELVVCKRKNRIQSK